MAKRVLVLLAALILVALLAACSDDEDKQPTGPQIAPEQVLQMTQVQIPPALVKADDPKVKEVVNWIRAANALAETMAPMLRPQRDDAGTRATAPNLASGDTCWTWHPYSTLISTLCWWESDSAYHWSLTWDGTIDFGGDTATFDDYTVVVAMEKKDLSHGYWYVSGTDDDQLVVFEWEWWQEPDGDFRLMAVVPDEWYIDLRVHADGSGEVGYYEDGQLELGAEWYADGSGQWWEYDSGVLVDSGSWS